jgi:fructose/tagatose bisphosphate aldolase
MRDYLENGNFLCAFNVNDQMDIQGIISASKKTEESTILLISQNAARFSGLNELIYLCRSYASKRSASIFIALDHWTDIESALEACRFGVDMIMFDYSKESYEKIWSTPQMP